MLPLERQNKILEILSKKQAVTVDELCARLYSSGATIRRDLQALESNGLLRRTHGGAVFVDGNARDFPLTMRETENLIPKSIIAKRALPYIHEGQTLFMDASSTVCQLSYNAALGYAPPVSSRSVMDSSSALPSSISQFRLFFLFLALEV